MEKNGGGGASKFSPSLISWLISLNAKTSSNDRFAEFRYAADTRSWEQNSLSSGRRLLRVPRTRNSEGSEMLLQWRETPVEGVFIGCQGTFVFHRYPQIHCERLRRKGANLSNQVFDRSWRQAVRTERSEPTKIRDRCRQSLRGQPTKRTLDDCRFQVST